MFNDNINSFGDILEQYMKWDANNYVRIATGGYTYYTEGENFTTLAFFPLYPWLMRIVNIIFRDLRVSGLLTSFALYSGACCFLYKLFSIDYSKSVAVRAIVYMSVFPHALFFGTLMNESMLLFTSAATLYNIRKHKWYLVGIWVPRQHCRECSEYCLRYLRQLNGLNITKYLKSLKTRI